MRNTFLHQEVNSRFWKTDLVDDSDSIDLFYMNLLFCAFILCFFDSKGWTLLLLDVFGPLEERQQWRLWSIDIWMDEWRDGWLTGIEWGCWDPRGWVGSREDAGGGRAGRATWCLVSLFQGRGWHHGSVLVSRRLLRASFIMWRACKRLPHSEDVQLGTTKGRKRRVSTGQTVTHPARSSVRSLRRGETPRGTRFTEETRSLFNSESVNSDLKRFTPMELYLSYT